MDLARAVAHANTAFKEIVGEDVITYPVANDIRREAGFSEEEIESARTLAARN